MPTTILVRPGDWQSIDITPVQSNERLHFNEIMQYRVLFSNSENRNMTKNIFYAFTLISWQRNET